MSPIQISALFMHLARLPLSRPTRCLCFVRCSIYLTGKFPVGYALALNSVRFFFALQSPPLEAANIRLGLESIPLRSPSRQVG